MSHSPPECFQTGGLYTFKGEVFALGILLYHLVALELPVSFSNIPNRKMRLINSAMQYSFELSPTS